MKKHLAFILNVGLLICLVACPGRGIGISPFFDLKMADINTLTEELPPPSRNRIRETPGHFLALLYTVLQEPPEFTWLVDKQHSLQADYVPPDLADLKESPVKIAKASLLFRKAALADFLAMTTAARKDNIELIASSTYRSYSYQDALFKYWVKQLGLAQAEIESARPGTSQHQLGTTIDFDPITDDFGSLPAYRWLVKRGWEFGFSLSYPQGYREITGYKYEPWHWRYIGKPAADMCRTYFDNIQQYFLEFWHKNRSFFTEHLKTQESGQRKL